MCLQVPEVTRGLIELVDFAQSAVVQHGSPTPMVVHCNLGADRSSMFVGLSILVQQLRVEHRVDIFIVTRKLCSQRQAMINSYVCILVKNGWNRYCRNSFLYRASTNSCIVPY